MTRLKHRAHYAFRLVIACLKNWKVLLEHCSSITGVKIMLRPNQLLIVDQKRKVLVRSSVNPEGKREIRNNREFLARNSHPAFPKSLHWSEDQIRFISCETQLAGRTPQAGEITDEMSMRVISLLNDALYDRFATPTNLDIGAEMDLYENRWIGVPESFAAPIREVRERICSSVQNVKTRAMKTLIHGDLTYRNLVLNDTSIACCDWARNEISFPEFDMYLFAIDVATYREPQVSFARFFEKVLDLEHGDLVVKEVEDLYCVNPKFAVNRQSAAVLRKLFLYRTLLFSLEYLKHDVKEMRELIYHVRTGIPSI